MKMITSITFICIISSRARNLDGRRAEVAPSRGLAARYTPLPPARRR